MNPCSMPRHPWNPIGDYLIHPPNNPTVMLLGDHPPSCCEGCGKWLILANFCQRMHAFLAWKGHTTLLPWGDQ